MATKRPDLGNRVKGRCHACEGPLIRGRCLGICLSQKKGFVQREVAMAYPAQEDLPMPKKKAA